MEVHCFIWIMKPNRLLVSSVLYYLSTLIVVVQIIKMIMCFNFSLLPRLLELCLALRRGRYTFFFLHALSVCILFYVTSNTWGSDDV